MNLENKKQFALVMAKLETAFFESISKESVILYFEYLNDLSINQVERAVDYLIKTREKRGFPSIAEIRAATLGSTEYKAIQAWGELLGQTYKDKIFKDSIIPEVARIAFGSLQEFYAGDTRNEMADRAHFIRAYKLIANLKEAQKGRRLGQKEKKLLKEES